ncbi:MAG: hypothetical protein H6834_17090 [Planctomycetes bacterium]|nr:hypothetical protein [Planctomycetota bacterium]
MPSIASFPDLSTFMEDVEPVVRLDRGRLYAASPRWKADFASDSVGFRSALGPHIEGPLESRFSLVDIRRGDTVIARPAEDRNALPTFHEKTIVYEHALGIHETYEARKEGLKQSFTFDRKLPGSGDLVVRMRLETPLTSPPGVHSAGMDFVHGSEVIMSLGMVQGFDAVGRSRTGVTRYDGEFLEFVLPASFVDSARFPLVLDPLISGSGTTHGTGSNTGPDLAYDNDNRVYLLTWKYIFSSSDHDTYGRLVTVDGTHPGLVLAIFVSTETCDHPRVASINSTDSFYVVAAETIDFLGNTDWQIIGTQIDAASGSQGATISVDWLVGIDNQNPDVCGERTTLDNDCLVVYQNSLGQIITNEVSLDANLDSHVISGRKQVAGSGSDPVICKSGGDQRRAFIAWEYPGGYVADRAIDMNSNFLSDTGVFAGQNGVLVSKPSVDGDGRRFLLAYQQVNPNNPGTYDIWTTDLFVPTSPNSFPNYSRQAALTSAAVDETRPSVACMTDSQTFLGASFAVAWREGTDVIRATTLLDNGTSCGGEDLIASGTTVNFPRIVSEYSGGGTPVGGQHGIAASLAWREVGTSSSVIKAAGWRAGCAPSNDDCAGAFTLQLGPNGPFTNLRASYDPQTPVSLYPGPDVWFKYTPQACGVWLIFKTCRTISNVATQLQNVHMEIWQGSCGSLSLVSGLGGFSCQQFGLQQDWVFNADPSTTYYVRIATNPPGQMGEFNLDVTEERMGTVTNLGGSCNAQAGSPSLCGILTVPDSNHAVQLSGAPANQPTYLFLADTGVPTRWQCNQGCSLIFPSFIVPMTTSSTGTASVALPIPNSPNLLNAQFTLQWVTQTPGVAPCVYADFSPSDVLHCTIQ